jgi:hypothetical protein
MALRESAHIPRRCGGKKRGAEMSHSLAFCRARQVKRRSLKSLATRRALQREIAIDGYDAATIAAQNLSGETT